jgi:hypothetical protein
MTCQLTDARRQQQAADRAVAGRADHFNGVWKDQKYHGTLEIQRKPLISKGSGNFDGLSPEPP